MGLLYGRTGRLTAQNGGFRPGQWIEKLDGYGSGVRSPSHRPRAAATHPANAALLDCCRLTRGVASRRGHDAAVAWPWRGRGVAVAWPCVAVARRPAGGRPARPAADDQMPLEDLEAGMGGMAAGTPA